MDRLAQALGRRRRLWPPDEGSSIACLGLLGWMQMMHLHSDQIEHEMRGWVWLGGLLETGPKTPRLHQSIEGFNEGDQRAIDAYAAAVAGRVLRVDGRNRTEWSEASRNSKWQPLEIEILITLGQKHGDVMREMLLKVFANFECRLCHDVLPFGESHAGDLSGMKRSDDGETDPHSGSLSKELQTRDAAFFENAQMSHSRRSS